MPDLRRAPDHPAFAQKLLPAIRLKTLPWSWAELLLGGIASPSPQDEVWKLFLITSLRELWLNRNRNIFQGEPLQSLDCVPKALTELKILARLMSRRYDNASLRIARIIKLAWGSLLPHNMDN